MSRPTRAPAVAASVRLCAAFALAPAAALAQGAASDAIRLNQVGYYAAAPKAAVVVDTLATRFAVVRDGGRGAADTVLTGRLGAPRPWAPSGETVRVADFGALRRPGRYRLVVGGVGASHPFDVSDTALRAVARASIKGFYYQRASTPLTATHAGRWARPAGHPDTAVRVHPSAADARRAANTLVRSPGGWYDAGDYGKYVVNSGISTYTLLLLAEQQPAWSASLRTDIPESGGALPDLLDEALVNLRWMLTMQDSADGGVYHKLTTAEFDPMEMPHADTGARWVVQKSAAATLDLAAVAAHASHLAREYPRALPGLADSLVRAATRAWGWARLHPDSVYGQRRINERHRPAVNTGEYGDTALTDELRWAAAELWLATRQDSFLVAAAPLASEPARLPGWPTVATLGLYSLLEHRTALPPRIDTTALRRRLIELADTLVARRRASPYGVAMVARDFVWGSSAVAANQGMALVQAYRLTRDTSYLHAAVATLDYLLGRNAIGMSFVTGHGARSPMHPHHRPSEADGVVDPVPGLLAGGPNPARQDRCEGYPSTLPAKAYLDHVCSYASNEIAINWNAPLAYLAGAIDAIYSRRR